MFKNIISIATISWFLLALTSCVTIVDVSTEGPIKTDPGKRSFGEYWDDKQITTIVGVNIKKASPALDRAHINVNSYRGVVLLTGEVQNAETRLLAAETANNVARVRQVYNELQIKPNAGFLDRTSDNVIQTKINTKLLVYKDIDSNRVKVIVEDDIVYLMGLLTRTQVEKVTDIVRKTKGVRKVVRAIEYLEDAS